MTDQDGSEIGRLVFILILVFVIIYVVYVIFSGGSLSGLLP